MSTVAERVAAGVKYLDSVLPEWRNKVSVNTFNIRSSEDCVLGHLFKSNAEDNSEFYSDGFDYGLRNYVGHDRLVEFGFDVPGSSLATEDAEYNELQQEWERVLADA